MRIPAKFQGRCATCGGPIARGDEIEYRDKKAHHPGCAEDGGGISVDDQRALAARLGFVSYDEAMAINWSLPLVSLRIGESSAGRSDAAACWDVGAAGEL